MGIQMVAHGQLTLQASHGMQPVAQPAAARSSTTTSFQAPRLPLSPSTWPSSPQLSTTVWVDWRLPQMLSALTAKARLSQECTPLVRLLEEFMATIVSVVTLSWTALSSVAWQVRQHLSTLWEERESSRCTHQS